MLSINLLEFYSWKLVIGSIISILIALVVNYIWIFKKNEGKINNKSLCGINVIVLILGIIIIINIFFINPDDPKKSTK